MPRASAELASLRQQTAEFISSNPVNIVLIRIPKVDDGAGGWTEGDPVPQAEQTVKIQPAGRGRGAELTSPSAGSVDETLHHILGNYDLNIQVGDEFDWNGYRWKVQYVDDSLDYRTLAEAVHSGD